MKTLIIKSPIDQAGITKFTYGGGALSTQETKNFYFNIMDKYIDAGGNCIDVARIYADGVCEELFGQWLTSRNNRNKIIISTKGGHPPLSDMTISRLSKKELEYDINQSLKALKTDYVDIFFLHRDNPSIPVEEIMTALNSLVKSGKTRFLGASNWTTKRINEANNFAVKNGLVPFSISQIFYSLAITTPEKYGDKTLVCMNDQEYKWYLDNSFPVMAYTATAKGFFTKKINFGMDYNVLPMFEKEINIIRAKRVLKLSQETGFSPSSIALAYLTCNKVETSAISMSNSIEQLNDSLNEQNIFLTDEQISFLEGK